MGDITSKKPAATFESILKIGTGDNQNVDTTLRVVEDGTGVASALYLATDSALISGNGIKLYFYDADGGEHISADNAGDLTIAAGTALNITADIIDLSDATKAITLNAAANALNFDSNTLTIDASNNRVGVGTAAPTAKLDINSDILRLRTAKTPASASDSGNAGDICWDASYIYVCVATNTWERSAIASW